MNTSARDRNERSPGADKFQVSKEMKSGGLLVSLERKSHFLPAGVSGSHGTPNHEEWERKQNSKSCDTLWALVTLYGQYYKKYCPDFAFFGGILFFLFLLVWTLYSYNQLFRTNRKSTPTRDRQKFEFGELCKVWKIPMFRCVYVGKPKTETRTFVSESPSLVRLFFERYGVPKDCVIYCDNGKSFFEDGTSVLGELGFSKHLTYPACVHQFLSPNDNRHHGPAKAAWRNAGIEFTNDVLAAIRLLRFLEKDATAHSEEYFNRNLLLISEESSKTMINGRKDDENEYLKNCLWEYQSAARIDPRGDQSDIPEQLRTSLDGRRWSS